MHFICCTSDSCLSPVRFYPQCIIDVAAMELLNISPLYHLQIQSLPREPLSDRPCERRLEITRYSSHTCIYIHTRLHSGNRKGASAWKWTCSCHSGCLQVEMTEWFYRRGVCFYYAGGNKMAWESLDREQCKLSTFGWIQFIRCFVLFCFFVRNCLTRQSFCLIWTLTVRQI